LKRNFFDVYFTPRTALLPLMLSVLGNPCAFAATFGDAEAARQRGDYASALPLYSTLADAGDAQAMARLGGLYQKGEGVNRDLKRAIAYYTQAAARGNADAQFSLGNLYLLGEGVPQDDDWAFTYYRQAAEQGHALAQKNVNEFYRAAGISPPTPPAAVTIRSVPAASEAEAGAGAGAGADSPIGTVPAEYSDDELRAIEMVRAQGIQVDRAPGTSVSAPPSLAVTRAEPPRATPLLADIKRRIAAGKTTQARRDLEILADGGNTEAQFLLSRLLVTLGPGIDGEALLWLKSAAHGGEAEAQYALAEAYRRGEGTPVDEAEAVTWYRAAARQGHAGARQQLEAVYRDAGIPLPETLMPASANSAQRDE
jgi:TPR repeat protein